MTPTNQITLTDDEYWFFCSWKIIDSTLCWPETPDVRQVATLWGRKLNETYKAMRGFLERGLMDKHVYQGKTRWNMTSDAYRALLKEARARDHKDFLYVCEHPITTKDERDLALRQAKAAAMEGGNNERLRA